MIVLDEVHKDPEEKKTSQIPLAIDRNSASALLLATAFCFLLLHVTKFLHTNVQYPDVDFLSLIEPAQLASVNTSIGLRSQAITIESLIAMS